MRRIIMLSLVVAAVAAALLVAPRSQDVAAQAGPDDIEQILLEIDGIPVASGVVAVSGLAISNDISAIRDANGNIVGEVVRPTSPAEPTFVLEPGRLADEIWEWYAQVRAGGGQNRSMSVVFLSNREEVFRYNLLRALPKSYLLQWLFLGGREPPAPGPRSCGSDGSQDELIACEYTSC